MRISDWSSDVCSSDLNGSYSDHSQLEADLADFYGRRGCMVFSTGYQANLGILSTLAGKGDYLIVDAASHASIYDGCNLRSEERRVGKECVSTFRSRW